MRLLLFFALSTLLPAPLAFGQAGGRKSAIKQPTFRSGLASQTRAREKRSRLHSRRTRTKTWPVAVPTAQPRGSQLCVGNYLVEPWRLQESAVGLEPS